jgi:hypothetical protein
MSEQALDHLKQPNPIQRPSLSSAFGLRSLKKLQYTSNRTSLLPSTYLKEVLETPMSEQALDHFNTIYRAQVYYL